MESLPFTFTMLKSFIITNVLVLFTVQESRQASNGHGHFLNMEDLKLEFIAEPGDNVTLPCRFSTDRSMELTMLKISWSKDGKEMWTFSMDSQKDETRLEELSNGHADWHLSHIQREDGGNYICHIKYRSLEKEVTRTVIVSDPAGHSSTPNSQNDIVSRPHSTPPSQDVDDLRPHSTPPSRDVKDPEPHSTPPVRNVEEPRPHSTAPLRNVKDPRPRSTPPSRNVEEPRPHSTPPSRNVEEPRPHSTPPLRKVEELSPPSSRKDVESSPTPSTKEATGSPLNADDEFRTAKITVVTAVLSVSWCLVFLLFYYLPKLN